MKQFEINVMQSFSLAKKDIIQLQTKVIELSQNQQRILEILTEVERTLNDVKNASKPKTTKRKTAKKTSKKKR